MRTTATTPRIKSEDPPEELLACVPEPVELDLAVDELVEAAIVVEVVEKDAAVEEEREEELEEEVVLLATVELVDDVDVEDEELDELLVELEVVVEDEVDVVLEVEVEVDVDAGAVNKRTLLLAVSATQTLPEWSVDTPVGAFIPL